MRAVTWHGKRDVRVDTVPDPAIEQPTDAIIRVTSTGICGSDLHLYEVLGPFIDAGDILGHEPMGIVEEVGAEVTHIAARRPRRRSRSTSPAGTASCATSGLQSQCETTQVREHGTGAALFGYTKLYGQVPGGQAEFLRVPQAHFGPIKVPEGPPDDRFVYLSDVLPTAWQAVEYADVPDGDTRRSSSASARSARCAARIAQHRGAEQVIGVDLVPERLERARARGVEVLDLDERRRRRRPVVRELHRRPRARRGDRRGRHGGARRADRHGSRSGWPGCCPTRSRSKLMQTAGIDRLSALHLAIELVRRGGTSRSPASTAAPIGPMPLMQMFDKQIQLRMGQANVKRWVDDILPLLTDDDPLGVDDFATHHLPLEEAPERLRDRSRRSRTGRSRSCCSRTDHARREARAREPHAALRGPPSTLIGGGDLERQRDPPGRGEPSAGARREPDGELRGRGGAQLPGRVSDGDGPAEQQPGIDRARA